MVITDNSLPPPILSLYQGALSAVETLAQQNSTNAATILHGSVGYRDIGFSAVPLIPLSDIDLLIIAKDIQSLIHIGPQLAMLRESFALTNAPFFKISAKYRLISEIDACHLSANEACALKHGYPLAGKISFKMPPLPNRWFQRQVDLSIATRLFYDRKLLSQIQFIATRLIHERYLAAKLLLTIPTLALLQRTQLGGRHEECVDLFINGDGLSRLPKCDQDQLIDSLMWALAARRGTTADGINHDLSSAQELFNSWLKVSLLSAKGPLEDESVFWRTRRPLDMRDKEIERGNSGEARYRRSIVTSHLVGKGGIKWKFG